MHGPPDEDQKEGSPDVLEHGEASGIEALPGRVNRYGIAKKRALDVVKYAKNTSLPVPSTRIEKCGEYLAFRHYYTVDQVRLHAARFCKVHLLCPLCAIRRGSKALSAYLPRYEAVRASRPDLVPFLVTLTVKDGPDLQERFAHLHLAMRELWKRRARGRGSAVDCIEAGVWSYEVKRGSGSGEWHPHLHMVALASIQPDKRVLSLEWKQITGDSLVVDVRPIDQEAPERGFIEVFKYALKFSDMTEGDTLEAWRVLRGRRLVASVGLFRGVEIPEQLTDEPLDDLPFVEYFYRYFDGCYGLSTERGVPERVTSD